MSIPRYYYMWLIEQGWAVFDREWVDRQGECLPIALCVTKTYAVAIRDALNHQHENV